MIPFRIKKFVITFILFAINILTSQAVTFSEEGNAMGSVKAYAPVLRGGGETPTICPFCGSSDIDTTVDPAVCNECGYEVHTGLGGDVPLDGGEWLVLVLLAGVCACRYYKTQLFNR